MLYDVATTAYRRLVQPQVMQTVGRRVDVGQGAVSTKAPPANMLDLDLKHLSLVPRGRNPDDSLRLWPTYKGHHFPDGFKFAPPDPNASAASKRALAQKMDAIDERFAAVRRDIEVQYGLR